MGVILSTNLRNFGDDILLKVIEKGGNSDIPRFRKIYIDKKDEDEGERNYIVAIGRCGGGNRDEYQDDIDLLKENKLYINDYDDEGDSTYAQIIFKIPDEYKYLIKFEEMLANNKIPTLENLNEITKSIDNKDDIYEELIKFITKLNNKQDESS